MALIHQVYSYSYGKAYRGYKDGQEGIGLDVASFLEPKWEDLVCMCMCEISLVGQPLPWKKEGSGDAG